MQNYLLKIKYYLLVFPLFLIACNPHVEKGFEKIPPGLSLTEDLIRAIRPDKDYQYWACIRQDFSGKIHPKTEIITGHGNISYLMNNKFDQPQSGFLAKMWSGYFYIAYVEKDSLKLVTSRAELIRFIGKIDGLEEALLLAEIDDLAVDYDRDIGGAYQKTKKGFEFYLARFRKCTVRTEPFRVSIDSMGNIKAKSLGFYYNVDDTRCYD
ncbi:hypothetical protein [Pedobacter sp. UBA5917]|jgi:hypothetical protein|uniref:hypothetical protein n=1 Tax=Pedobacter sp. UBA5917 TaxID=1947061 RepID=UPI0025CE548F|nr:hypothetical protein [Pedobacter sp. UBA5917]